MSKVKVGIYTLWHFDTYGQPMSFDEMVDYLHNDGAELYVNVCLSNPKPVHRRKRQTIGEQIPTSTNQTGRKTTIRIDTSLHSSDPIASVLRYTATQQRAEHKLAVSLWF